MQKQSKQAKKGQNLAFSILKSTPAQKKYTTVGCGGCDKYELCIQDKEKETTKQKLKSNLLKSFRPMEPSEYAFE